MTLESTDIAVVANGRARREDGRKTPTDAFAPELAQAVRAFHRTIPGYRPTPLVDLRAAARRLGLSRVWVKDESSRFGLNAFKVLGASYALARLVGRALHLPDDDVTFANITTPDSLAMREEMTFITATDGNHGRALAWFATQLGSGAVVYMPRGTAAARFEAVASHGADVSVIEGGYDDAVRLACETAADRGWALVQDTSWPGYEETPTSIMQGYTTLISESLEQMHGEVPTHVFVQCGVGSLAAAIQAQLHQLLGERRPHLTVVEPAQAACVFTSMSAGGKEKSIAGELDTIMAGLACGTPSRVAFRILRDYADAFVSCSDEVSILGMRRLARPWGDDPSVVSGESGAVTAGLLSALLDTTNRSRFSRVLEVLQLGARSKVLLISTEGNTDPIGYRRFTST